MIVNLTPHKLVIRLGVETENPLTITYPSAGVARCSVESVPAGDHEAIPLVYARYAEVTGLPDPQEDVLYVVSAVVRLALPHRTDLASPGGLIRDNEGRVVAAQHLIVNERKGEK